jgi:hypothetical protein
MGVVYYETVAKFLEWQQTLIKKGLDHLQKAYSEKDHLIFTLLHPLAVVQNSLGVYEWSSLKLKDVWSLPKLMYARNN